MLTIFWAKGGEADFASDCTCTWAKSGDKLMRGSVCIQLTASDSGKCPFSASHWTTRQSALPTESMIGSVESPNS
jgi:hypothetical protein